MTSSCNPLKTLASFLVALSVVFQLTSLCVLLLTPMIFALTPDSLYHDYCVIGAGPAGLQLGYFLKRANRDYIVFERSNITGQFFVDYPRHRKLISINKRYTGKTNKEFNLRHDWNSLLSDDDSLLFKEYSKELFPNADRLVDYLRDYQQKLGINVKFSTEIGNIRNVMDTSMPDGVRHLLDDQHGNTYDCRALVLATGMWKPNIPNMRGIEYADGYETMSLNPDDYEGKSVLILGRGNTAFEVADGMYGVTNLIHMVSRSRVRLSWETHYVGDLRAVNNALLDTYQLKSLDGVLEASLNEVELKKTEDGQLKIAPKEESFGADLLNIDNFAMREPYDKVVRCLGFTFDSTVFQNQSTLSRGRGRASKYLSIHHNYESKSMPGVFLAGTATHSLDFRKSAGGFIHGFRYTVQALSRLLEWRYEAVQWPAQNLPVTQLLNVLLKRLNEASGLYQMFQILGDVGIFSEDGQSVDFIEEFPINLLHELPKYTGRSAKRLLVLVMEYGPDFSGPGKDIFRYDRATGEPSEAHTSNFLHPVFYYYETLPTDKQMKMRSNKQVLPRPAAMHHMVEDFLTLWDAPLSHVAPLRHFLDHITSSDLRNRFAQSCFMEAMTHSQPSPSCMDQYMQGQGLTASPDMVVTARESGIYSL